MSVPKLELGNQSKFPTEFQSESWLPGRHSSAVVFETLRPA